MYGICTNSSSIFAWLSWWCHEVQTTPPIHFVKIFSLIILIKTKYKHQSLKTKIIFISKTNLNIDDDRIKRIITVYWKQIKNATCPCTVSSVIIRLLSKASCESRQSLTGHRKYLALFLKEMSHLNHSPIVFRPRPIVYRQIRPQMFIFSTSKHTCRLTNYGSDVFSMVSELTFKYHIFRHDLNIVIIKNTLTNKSQ